MRSSSFFEKKLGKKLSCAPRFQWQLLLLGKPHAPGITLPGSARFVEPAFL